MLRSECIIKNLKSGARLRMCVMKIETAKFQYTGTETVVEYIYPELSAICPKTGLPDYYTLKIVFVPDEILPELKSLKMYLVEYRSEGIWHEHLLNRIMDDFVEAVRPKWVYMLLVANPRGGITTKVHRYWDKDGENRVLEFMTGYGDAGR